MPLYLKPVLLAWLLCSPDICVKQIEDFSTVQECEARKEQLYDRDGLPPMVATCRQMRRP